MQHSYLGQIQNYAGMSVFVGIIKILKSLSHEITPPWFIVGNLS